ncbi:DUF397 domain-containing protein [Streptomyces bobili]|uniref:DUF397 domain-containing protein n=1 Tax=Streptomyces bobili TaxID=67280 RepID=UPI0036EFE781
MIGFSSPAGTTCGDRTSTVELAGCGVLEDAGVARTRGWASADSKRSACSALRGTPANVVSRKLPRGRRRPPRRVPVRDSKVPDGEVLVFGAASWAAFLTHTARG